MELGVSVTHIPDHHDWLPDELIHIFSRLLINGWLSGDMTPTMAERWGTKIGHWGRIALVHQDVQAEGFKVIQGAFGAR